MRNCNIMPGPRAKLKRKKASEEALRRRDIIQKVDRLRDEGCRVETAAQAVGTTRPTYYRWRRLYLRGGLAALEPKSRRPRRTRSGTWTNAQKEAVLAARKRFPTWGKSKIRTLLERDHGIVMSESMVGRILASLVKLDLMLPAIFWLWGALKATKKRVFDGWARPWREADRRRSPGWLVQMDHMSITIMQKTFKVFVAVCPATKLMCVRAYTKATATCASDFLRRVVAELGVDVRSFQVDGGGEFRKDFEAACQSAGIPLYVLPAKSPKLNGCVERLNGIIKGECLRQYRGRPSAEAVNRALDAWRVIYTTVRPHGALDNLTPEQYRETILQAA